MNTEHFEYAEDCPEWQDGDSLVYLTKTDVSQDGDDNAQSV